MKILIVCGAGASSTFVAQRLRRAASAAALAGDFSAGAGDAVAESLADLVLVGPHLINRVAVIHACAHCPVAVLPPDVFSDHDGTRTLRIAQSALSESSRKCSGDEPSSTAKGTS